MSDNTALTQCSADALMIYFFKFKFKKWDYLRRFVSYVHFVACSFLCKKRKENRVDFVFVFFASDF